METVKTFATNKGGRPKKPVRKDHVLTLKCSLTEKCIIEAKAKKSGLTISQYLRAAAINGKIDMPKNCFLPKFCSLPAHSTTLLPTSTRLQKKETAANNWTQ